MMFGKSKLQFALKSEVDKMLVFRFEDLACQANITNDANNNNKSVYFDISKRFFLTWLFQETICGEKIW